MPDTKPRRVYLSEVLLLLLTVAILVFTYSQPTPKTRKAKIFIAQVHAMRAAERIHTAQAQYLAQFGHFATSLAQLGPPAEGVGPNPEGADLIGADLVTGTNLSYKITLQPTPGRYTISVYGLDGRLIYSDPPAPPILQ